ncbi:carbohydrate ABC transporter permease [Paenibacillus sp. LHD-117]|uniref:carbohydrate ABC transporter permease n=1 Tax=Paenibacillus sp. LHD-117 TaxID=3071412 RepID=UPI0027E1C565|nr:carbohydrate ABC transporter permease [Paenibacillus sp. LHD-117]MDQ6420175.1 carbohydrate ABC transporter permease [Paenibacillus sp. LHD-117]
MKVENRFWRVGAHLPFIIFSAACIIPFVLLATASLTSESELLKNGYSFFPSEISWAAYEYLWKGGKEIFRAYGITIFVTVVGTAVSLLITSLIAYPMSRKDYPAASILAFVVFLTMLFNGGLVPTYLVYTQIFHVKDTLFALLIPGLLMNGFSVMLMRTFFQMSIPMPIIESASIDGAGEWRTYWSFILPLSMPIMATVGLLQTLIYWNDWMNGTIYLTDTSLYGIQNLLNQILTDAQAASSGIFGSISSSAEQAAPLETVKMAIAVIGVLPIMAAYPFFQKYYVKGIVIGSVKG